MKKYLIFLLIIAFFSCSKNKPDGVFELMDNNSIGINFQNTITNSDKFNIFNYRNFYNGGGVAIGDINNDGLPDIFFTANMGANKLYLNKGKGTSESFQFEDISKKAGIADSLKWNTGAVMVDINNDGLLDIYVCNAGVNKFITGQKNSLFINNGNLTFTESAAKYGLDEGGYTTHAAFFDYDLDGDLDCYILNNSFIPVNTLDYSNNREMRAEDWPVKDFLKGGGHKLLRNDDGFFHDVSKETGIYSSLISFGLGVTIGDVNNDNYPDIYVSNDFYEKDYLYINQKNGTFKEEIEQRMKHISLASMGADMADINNDGYQEIITTDMLPRDELRLKTTASFDNNYLFKLKKDRGFFNQFQQNSLQLNNQDGTFSEIGNYAGVSASDWSWGALMFDADNDGYNDIYVCNGIYNDVIDQDFIDFFANELLQQNSGKMSYDKIIKQMPSKPQINNFFHNTHTLKFEEKAADFGFTTPSFSNGATYADLDNDGDLDLVVNNVNMPCFIYQNHSEKALNKNHYIKVKLQGDGKNTFAIGSKVEIFAKNKQNKKLIFDRTLEPSRGFQSSTEYPMTIGLGDITKIDSLKITWQDQRVTVVASPKVDMQHIFSIKDAKVAKNSTTKPANTLFEATNISFDKHQENEYEDFYQEKNIPMKLSSEGPKAAVGDVNGDGKEDMYICGAKLQAGQLYLQNATGGFTKSNQKIFTDFKDYEDTAAKFFDADNDGDLDLYVGSGGNELPTGERELLDRLYINDGKGNFTHSPKALPANTMNTAVIAPMDIDGDGDLDLFVGSRSYPKQYGLSPNNYIYENNGHGVFTDITKNIAPEISEIGMIRDAIWADINGDKKNELILVGDWMSPKIFTLNNKKLSNFDAGLENFTGFWGGLKVVDIDNDGDNDLILGNIGENCILKASPDAPLKLWIKDFDNNGTIDKVLSKTVDGKDVPVFLKREMTEQFPSLKKQSLKFSEYATKSIQELFPAEVLQDAKIKTVKYCKSVIAINDGKGHFSFIEMPETAQLSCINAIETGDFNHDGLMDIMMGGNFTHFIPQFGMIDANRGTILINKGKNHFEVLSNKASGYLVDGELKQICPIKIKNQINFVNLLNDDVPKIFKLK